MRVAENIDKAYTLEEYIKLDETGTVRHEFFNGKLYEMPGETLLHNEICSTLLILLTNLLKNKGWRTYIESVKVKIGDEEIYLYPDIVVKQTEQLQKTNYRNYIISNPLLIAEVLSDSTRKYDSTDKFILYQKISTLKYYLLVEPEKHVVIFYEKGENNEWSAFTFTEMEEVIKLPALEAEIKLADIYS